MKGLLNSHGLTLAAVVLGVGLGLGVGKWWRGGEAVVKSARRPELIYFDGRGLGELCRLTLVECGVEFEDRRVTDEEEEQTMPKLKPSLPFGQLPVLKVGDVTIAQSNSIVRYLGQTYNLMGSTPEEQALVDMILEGVSDVRRKRDPLRYFDVPEEHKSKYIAKYWTEEHQKWSLYFENMLSKHRKNWIIGDTFTVADLAIFNFFSSYLFEKPELFNGTPRLVALIRRVELKPSLSAYLKGRPPKASWDL